MRVKSKSSSLVKTILVFFMVFLSFSNTVHGENAKDITDKLSNVKTSLDVKKIEWKPVFDENGNQIEEVSRYATIRLNINWQMLNMDDVNEGDYFTFNINSNGKLIFTDFNDKALIGDNNQEIGKFNFQNNVLKVTLNSNGAYQLKLSNGYFTITGAANYISEDISISVNGEAKIPSLVVKPSPPSVVPIIDNPESIRKNGLQINNQNSVNWKLFVGLDTQRKIYTEIVDGREINSDFVNSIKRDDLVLIDELTENQAFNITNEDGTINDKLKIIFNLTAPRADGELLNMGFYQKNVKNIFTFMPQTVTDTTVDEYITRIKGNSEPAYGVYNNKTLVVSFKNVPTNTTEGKLKLNAFYNDIVNYVDSKVVAGTIDEVQANIVKKAYNPDNALNGDIPSFQVSVSSDTSGEGEYHNEAKITYNNTQDISKTAVVNVTDVNSGVGFGTGKAKLTKVEEGNISNKLKGAIFNLEMKNKSGEWVNFKNGLETNDDGEISFNNLGRGDFRFKEIQAPNNFDIKDTSLEFKIASNETEHELQLTFENKRTEPTVGVGKVEVEKVKQGAKDVKLSGAEFQIYKEDGTKINEKVGPTDASGKAISNDLESGKYYFVEIAAPTGYELNNTKYNFEIKNNEVFSFSNDKSIENKKNVEPGPDLEKPRPKDPTPDTPGNSETPSTPDTPSVPDTELPKSLPKTGLSTEEIMVSFVGAILGILGSMCLNKRLG